MQAQRTGAGDVSDTRALRRAFGAFATGVTVAATLDAAGAPVGLTVNSFTSVSLEPPLALVCIARSAASHGAFAANDSFAVSILSDHQRALAQVFAMRGVDKFAGVGWSGRVTGAPVLDGAVAWLDCRGHSRIEAGDHDVLIGRVVDFARGEGAPLGYVDGGFAVIDRAPRVCALLTRGPGVLVRLLEAGVALPAAARLGAPEDADSVLGQLAAAGFASARPRWADAFDIGALHAVVYRAEALAGEPAAGWAFMPLAQAEAAMLTPGGGVALRRLAERTVA